MFGVVSVRTAPLFRLLSPTCFQAVTVRGRKSRNDPKAKSKADRVKVPPPVDLAEMVVLKERFTQYELIIRALRAEFKEEMLCQRYEEEVGSLAEEKARHETEQHRMLMAWNDAENERLRKLREHRVKQEQEQEELKTLQVALALEKRMEEYIKEKELEILTLQEESKNFITLDNLEQRIEDALDNPKNYNFAIDKEGRIVKRTEQK
ncbi:28S ribosomal protein S26, mitochondrial [Erpetoichthys calabaricus]|uniref:Small ribosomal subunit protein mS26 n=1 Tax=Erpetoichthys calabaricus TaxID=27687 RepID=A0A8C4SXG3_ERPCA|nr:28S ribosomal protein S26, mitochondrial [Erpetoichthys calabaricus]